MPRHILFSTTHSVGANVYPDHAEAHAAATFLVQIFGPTSEIFIAPLAERVSLTIQPKTTLE